jgi:uncharacterized protein (DUF305 family)
MKGMIVLGVIIAALLGAGVWYRLDAYSPDAMAAKAELAAANDRMMQTMMGDAVVYTGDPDLDFVNLMIPHHQGAVDMARVEIRYGRNPKVVDLARRIEAAQQPQIDQMQAWKARHTVTPSPDAEAIKAALNAANDKMMAGMGHHGSTSSAMAPPGKPDHQFIDMMSPHHGGAVEMSDVVIRYGKDPEIRALVEEIKAVQLREIAEMAALTPAGHHH